MSDKEPILFIRYTRLCPLIFHPVSLYLNRIEGTQENGAKVMHIELTPDKSPLIRPLGIIGLDVPNN